MKLPLHEIARAEFNVIRAASAYLTQEEIGEEVVQGPTWEELTSAQREANIANVRQYLEGGVLPEAYAGSLAQDLFVAVVNSLR